MGYIEDLRWMQKHGLFTEDQITMIITKKAFVSSQTSEIWQFSNWKLGEY